MIAGVGDTLGDLLGGLDFLVVKKQSSVLWKTDVIHSLEEMAAGK